MLPRLRSGLSASLVGLLFIAAACGRYVDTLLDSRPAVTEQDARDLFAQAVDQTLERDFRSLCGLANSRSMCEIDLKSGALERAPTQWPKVACADEVPDVVGAKGRSLGGRVLVVDGVDGRGRRFVTEVLVFHDGKRLAAINAVWWSGRGIAVPTEPGHGSTSAVPETPESRLSKCEQPQDPHNS